MFSTFAVIGLISSQHALPTVAHASEEEISPLGATEELSGAGEIEELPSKESIRATVGESVQIIISGAAEETPSAAGESEISESEDELSNDSELSAANSAASPAEFVAVEENLESSATASENNSFAEISQSGTANASTGSNQANRNISIGGNAGVINTGDATAVVVGTVAANDTSIIKQESVANTSTVTSANGAVITQEADATANTGENIAERNISMGGSAGLIQTGSATAATSFLVTANNGVGVFGGATPVNGPGSGASIYIDTSVDPRYMASPYRTQSTVASTSNTATVSQTCGTASQSSTTECSVSTGHNSANRGVAYGGDAGVITTGDATLSVQFATFVNKSGFSTATSSPQHIDAISENQVRVNQEVVATVSTGHNTADRNISFGGNAGVITTGDATVLVEMYAVTNTTVGSSNEVSQPPMSESDSHADPTIPNANATLERGAQGSSGTSSTSEALVHPVTLHRYPELSYGTEYIYNYVGSSGQENASEPKFLAEFNLLAAIGRALVPAAHASSNESELVQPFNQGVLAQSNKISVPKNPYGTRIGALFAALAAVALTYLVRPLQGSNK